MGSVILCEDPRGHARYRYVTRRRYNESAFNGGRRTPSAYSSVRCGVCGHEWRSKAKYVDGLPDARPRIPFNLILQALKRHRSISSYVSADERYGEITAPDGYVFAETGTRTLTVAWDEGDSPQAAVEELERRSAYERGRE